MRRIAFAANLPNFTADLFMNFSRVYYSFHFLATEWTNASRNATQRRNEYFAMEFWNGYFTVEVTN